MINKYFKLTIKKRESFKPDFTFIFDKLLPVPNSKAKPTDEYLPDNMNYKTTQRIHKYNNFQNEQR